MAGADVPQSGPTRHIDLAPQQLTLAELATAAGVLGCSGVLGLEDLFAGRTRTTIERLAQQAAVALQERDLLERRADKSLHLTPWLTNLVQVAATAPHVLVLSASPVKEPARRLTVHLAKGSIVLQTRVGADQVLLTPIPERRLLNPHLSAFIAPRALRAAPGPSIVLKAEQVAELRTLAPDPVAVHALLVRSGLDDVHTAPFEMALTSTGERGNAVLYRRRQPPDLDNPLEVAGAGSWIIGPLGGWLMKQRVDGSETVHYAPTGRKDIRLVIERLIDGREATSQGHPLA